MDWRCPVEWKIVGVGRFIFVDIEITTDCNRNIVGKSDSKPGINKEIRTTNLRESWKLQPERVFGI